MWNDDPIGLHQRYMTEEGQYVTRTGFRVNLAAKLDHPGFVQDCAPLLKPGVEFDPHADAKLLHERILSLLPDSRTEGKAYRL